MHSMLSQPKLLLNFDVFEGLAIMSAITQMELSDKLFIASLITFQIGFFTDFLLIIELHCVSQTKDDVMPGYTTSH